MLIIFSCSEGDFVEQVKSRTSPKDLNMRTMMLKGVEERTTDTITCSRSDRRGSLKRCSGYNKKTYIFCFPLPFEQFKFSKLWSLMRQETYEKELQFHIPTKCQHALRDHLQFVLRCKQYRRCVRNNTRK